MPQQLTLLNVGLREDALREPVRRPAWKLYGTTAESWSQEGGTPFNLYD